MQDEPQLRSMLLQSIDSNSPNFLTYQNALQELMNREPQNLIHNLLNEVQDQNAPYNVVFLSLVLMDHCVHKSLIPITKENRYVQSYFPTDLILQLIDMTFNYFLHPEPAVRNTAIHLFSILAMTQLVKLSELGIDRRLIKMLNEAQSYEALWSATQCIWALMLHYSFSEEQKQIIIQNLFRILSLQSGNFSLIENCVKMLGNFTYLIERLFNDDLKFLDFVLQIMEFLEQPELEEVVYQFMDETINQFPELLPRVFEKLIQHSVNDLCKPAPRNVLIAITLMWDSIVGKRPAITEKIVMPLVQPLIMTMQSVSITEVLDYTEWEPYTASFQCLQCFGYSSPECVIPMLLEYAERASNSPNPFDREGALKCLKIAFQTSFDKVYSIIPSTLQLLSQQISDPAPRVRSEVVNTLLILLKKVPSWQPFSSFIPYLFNLTKDVDPTAKSSLKVLQGIARLTDFDQFQDFFSTLISLIPTLPPSLIQSGIECFTLTPESIISPDVVFISFQYLYNLIVQTINETPRNLTILDTLCLVISSIIMRCDERIAPYAQELCKMMYFSFRSSNDFSVSNALTVVANISYPLPNLVQEQLPIFVPLIIEAQESYSDPSILVPAVSVVPLLVDKLDLGPFFEMLMTSMFASLQFGETAYAKTEILSAFYKILATQLTKFAPFIPKLHGSILYIISNLEVAYQRYLEWTASIVTIICKIEVKLFHFLSRQDQTHIFNLCVLMLNTIVKMPPLLRLVNDDLFDIILCMYQIFGEETKQQLQQTPSICQIIRSGLKLLDKSDTEIESMLYLLTNQKQ